MIFDYYILGCLMRLIIGKLAATVAFMLCAYIFMGMFYLVPLISHQIFGESLIRFLTQLAVVFFLISAWAYWE